MKKIQKLIAATLMIMTGFSAFALDGKEIMEKVYDRQKPEFTKAAVELTLTAKNGAKEVRHVGEYGRDKNGTSDIVMIFLSPASVKNTRFLQKQNKGAEDDKWIYLPSLRTTRRVASSDGDKPFVGTDFTYDDMSTRKVEEDTHEYIKDEKHGDFDCYVVKSTPKDNKSQYLYRISWVDKDSMLPVFIEMYDKKGKLLKTSEVTKLEKKQGNRVYNVPMEEIMTNVQTGHSTTLKMKSIEIDKPLADGYFSPNFLSTGRL